jgi:hypothetical protein
MRWMGDQTWPRVYVGEEKCVEQGKSGLSRGIM